MVAIENADPNALILALAKEFESVGAIKAPEWAKFVKTGAHKERPPAQENWWYVRAAAVLRTVFRDGPIGVAKLRSKYGGRKNRGSKPEKFVKGSGNIIRKILQQLDAAGYTKKMDKGKGRVILPSGQAILQKVANSVGKALDVRRKAPEVKKLKEEVKPKLEEKKLEAVKVEKPKEAKAEKSVEKPKEIKELPEIKEKKTVQEEIKDAVKEAEKKEAPKEVKADNPKVEVKKDEKPMEAKK